MQPDSEEETLRASLAALWRRSLGPRADLSQLAPDASFRPGRHSPPQGGAGGPHIEGLTLADPVGQGGMGVIFAARQASLDRKVAVKIVHPDAGQRPEVRRDFLSEALVSGRLEHPNIVPVHDLRQCADGQPALVMKLVEGNSWQRSLREHPEAVDEHLDVLLQVCNAIAFAHSRGIVHNDLKPANVMLGSFGEVLVMDWGLAAAFGAQPAGSKLRHVRDISEPCGTPHYMPPELANGSGEKVGPASDIYLLGGLLYRILAGHSPHQQPSLIETLLAASLARYKPLPEHVPAELRALVARALAREPEDRIAGVSELQSALRDFLRHKQSLALSADATVGLLECQKQAAGPLRGPERNRLYRDFALVVAELQQALKLWPDNPQAQQAVIDARLSFARSAMGYGDLGLAEAQAAALPQASPAARELRGLVEAARRRLRQERRSRRLRQGLLRGVVLVLLAGIAGGLLWLYTKPVLLPLDTEPAGSEIWLNGVLQPERTPHTLTLEPGDYELRLLRPPFQPIAQELTVAWGEARGHVGGKLVHVPRFETWFFHSQPEGATVAITGLDGTPVRRLVAPASDTLSQGSYRVQFELDGFSDPAGETLIVVQGSVQPGSLRRRLEDMMGRVQFDGAEAFATAEVYARPSAAAWPLVRRQLADEALRLAPGSWRVFVGRHGEMVRGLPLELERLETAWLVPHAEPARWISRIPRDHHSSPLCVDLDGDGLLEVLLATSEGACCFDAQGSLLWQVPLGAVTRSHPLPLDIDGDGQLEVVFDREAGLVCLDAEGRRVWEYELAMAGMSGLAGVDLDGDGRLEVLAGGRSELACLDAWGALLWWHSLPSPASAPPLGVVSLVQGLPAVLQACGDRLVCLDGGGVPLWSAELPGEAFAAPAVGDLDGDGALEILLGCDDGTLLCWDSLGKELWRTPLGGEVLSSPALAGSDVFVATDAGIVALDARGKRLWDFPDAAGFGAAPVLLDSDDGEACELLAVSEAGELLLLAADRGEPLLRCRLEAWVDREPQVVDLEGDGKFEVIVADHAGILHCLPLPAGRRWEACISEPRGLRVEQGNVIEVVTERGAGIRFDEDGGVLSRWPGHPAIEASMRATRFPAELPHWVYAFEGAMAVALGHGGDLLWRAEVGGSLVARSALESRILLQDKDSLHCLVADGGLLWTRNLRYVSGADVDSTGFFAVDPEGRVRRTGFDGVDRWELPGDLARVFALQTSAGEAAAFLAVSESGDLVGLTVDGTVAWRRPVGLAMDGELFCVSALVHGTVYAVLGSQRSGLYCFDGSGALLWHRPMAHCELPPQFGDLDGDGSSELVVVDRLNIDVLALDGSVRWSRRLGPVVGIRRAPLLVNLDEGHEAELLVLATELSADRSRLVCLNHDGTVRWASSTRSQGVWAVAALPARPGQRGAVVLADNFGVACFADRRPPVVLWSAERARCFGVQPPR